MKTVLLSAALVYSLSTAYAVRQVAALFESSTPTTPPPAVKTPGAFPHIQRVNVCYPRKARAVIIPVSPIALSVAGLTKDLNVTRADVAADGQAMTLTFDSALDGATVSFLDNTPVIPQGNQRFQGFQTLTIFKGNYQIAGNSLRIVTMPW